MLVGGPDDAELADRIAARPEPARASAAGVLGLQETGAVIRRAEVLISGDTGVMHMATGVGTPVVAIFGPTVRQFGFFPYHSAAGVVERDLPCRPCSPHGRAGVSARPSPLHAADAARAGFRLPWPGPWREGQ